MKMSSFCSATLVFLVCASAALAREITLLDSDWRFVRGESKEGEQPGADTSNWQPVSVPHNYGWEEVLRDGKYQRGPAWYRHSLNLGAPEPGKRYFIRFEAAGSVADVYLNGHLLGQHRGAFGAFCYELTPHLSVQGTNLLAVHVNNAPQSDVAPLSGDFNVYGGLYRPVQLLVTSALCFTPTDHASPGVAWLQSNVSAAQAVIDVTAQVSNGSGKSQKARFVARILDAAGSPVAETNVEVTLPKSDTVPLSLRLSLSQPHLWNGRSDPYLYRAVVELQSGAEVCDSVEQPLGLRFFSIDPDKGFLLNGRPYHLHGVNLHQDRPEKGWAVSQADLEEDVRMLCEMGCTAVRCCHYQHSDAFYSLCDKAGVLVWAELPQVNAIAAGPAFAETSRNQWLDLLRQNINHPCIFTWSLFNELGANIPDPHRLLQDLRNIAHSEDPTRPTIAATCQEQLPQMNQIPDLLGWNLYPGWYSGTLADYGKLLDSHRFDSRQGGFCLSEYGAGANPEQHEQNVKHPKTNGPWHPEEWQALVHEAAWPAIKARPFVWGSFVWVMYDFASSTRNEGGVPGRNDKGLVTADRKVRKDAFYYYKANWSDEPTLYITSRRFTERTNAVTEVKIYSNAESVDLGINGATRGKGANRGCGVFVWENVQLDPGVNKITARALCHGQALEDHCSWTVRPASDSKR